MSAHNTVLGVVEADASQVLPSLGRASARQGLDALSENLQQAAAWLAEDLEALELDLRTLQMQLKARDDLAVAAAEHLLRTTGKRIRPICVLLAARLGGRSLDPVVRALAQASELVHTATLLHDDVIDQGDTRRGVNTARVVYGNSASILGGDHLLIRALSAVRGTGQPKALDELLETIDAMVAAEAWQLEYRGRVDANRDDYYRIIDGKTSSLFAWSLRAGAEAGGLDDTLTNALGEVGTCIGRAFQITDDAIDIEGLCTDTGKDALQDLRDGKMTLPWIIAGERDPALRDMLVEILDGSRPYDVSELVRRVNATEAVAEARSDAQRWVDVAVERLQHCPVGFARRALTAVAQASASRAM